MHLVFDFHKRRFGVGFAPFFDLTQDLCTLVQPDILFHELLFPLPFLLVSSYQLWESSDTPLQKSESHPVLALVFLF